MSILVYLSPSVRNPFFRICSKQIQSHPLVMTPRFFGLYNIVWQFLFCSFDALLSVFHKLFLQMSCKYMNFCFIDIVITLGLGKISENSSQYIHVITEAVNFQCPFLHFWIVFYRQAILRYLAMKYTNYAGYGLSLQQQMLSESVISWCFSEVHRYISILKKYSLSV